MIWGHHYFLETPKSAVLLVFFVHACVCVGVESIYNLLALGKMWKPYHWGASSPNLAEADRVLIDRCMLIFEDVQSRYVCSILFGSLNRWKNCWHVSPLKNFTKWHKTYRSWNMSMYSSKTSIPVKEHHLRYAMHQMNMLSGKTEYPPTLVNLQDDVSVLRKHFFPTHTFGNTMILRGTFLPLQTTYGNKRGALIMWKKKDVSQMYLLQTHSLDIRHLTPNQWTYVFLWNSDGNMPANPEVPQQPVRIDPPPGP